MHTIVITAKKNCLTHWQVVSCSVKVDGVTGILAKSPAQKEAIVRFEKKSEGGSCKARVKVDYLSRIALEFILDTSCHW